MRILRLAMAAVLLVYALGGLVAAALVAAFHAKLWSPPDDLPPGMIDLLASISWRHLALWAAAIGLYLFTVSRLVRNMRAFKAWGVAFLLDVASWLWFRDTGVLNEVFPSGLAHVDYAVFGANLAVGAVLLAIGRIENE